MVGSQSELTSFLRFIDDEVRRSGAFSITLETLCNRFEIDLVAAYRALYTGPSKHSGYLPTAFNEENLAEMAMFLSQFSEVDVHKVFRSAGAYLSRDDHAELVALYYDQVSAALSSHELRPDEFRQMCERYKPPRRAFEVYLDYFFEIDRICEETIQTFVSERHFDFPYLGDFFARKGLELLFQRHVVSKTAVFEGLFRKLTGTDDFDTPAGRSAGPVETALRTLGLPRLPKDRRELRLHYKSLMKSYHPDVNPEGLEMSKNINAAYAEIVSLWSEPF